jgi:hypothetical protein
VPHRALLRVSGSRRVLRTRRISQLNGLDSATGSSISPLRAATILVNARELFMKFRELKSLNHPSPRRHQTLQLFMPVEDDLEPDSLGPAARGSRFLHHHEPQTVR